MYICDDCDMLFDVPAEEVQPHGEMYSSCPGCGGSYSDAKYCPICGEYHHPEEQRFEVCDTCMKSKMTKDRVIAYAKDRGCEQDLYEWFFDCEFKKAGVEAMEVLRAAYIATHDWEGKTTEFVMEDPADWADYLEEVCKEV
jgi:methionyl-tRNA synthetase